MINVIICGCNGNMGQTLSRVISRYDDINIVAGFDISDSSQKPYPVFKEVAAIDVAADVIVDFSHTSALEDVLELAKTSKTPVVLATTGYSERQISEFREASKEVAVFRTANMSLGVNLMIDLIKRAAKVLEEGFDIEIVEKHHNLKIDAPSGTALMLANSIKAELSEKYEYAYDRHLRREKRRRKEIGIHSIRGGTIVGEHSVIFAGNDEVLEIKHSAASKEVFAEGAVRAIRFIAGKAPGLYDMSDVLSS